MTDADTALRALLLTLNPTAGGDVRRVLIRDQPDRDAISSHLLRAIATGEATIGPTSSTC